MMRTKANVRGRYKKQSLKQGRRTPPFPYAKTGKDGAPTSEPSEKAGPPAFLRFTRNLDLIRNSFDVDGKPRDSGRDNDEIRCGAERLAENPDPSQTPGWIGHPIQERRKRIGRPSTRFKSGGKGSATRLGLQIALAPRHLYRLPRLGDETQSLSAD
jgi:hypothetical protein